MSSLQSSHLKHKTTTQLVKIQGVLLDDPARRVVSVYDEDDWQAIHLNRDVRVGCRMPGCETLLTAKMIARTGTRFLATRKGGCAHFEVERPTSAGGGGEETKEHDWVKGRLARIAADRDIEAIIEHPETRADVYLPEPKIALEYQRVATNFKLHTQMRQIAGASLTIWLIRQQPFGKGPKTKLQKMFDEQVFQRGGLYLSVVDCDDFRTVIRPWDDPKTLNRRARLRVSGSTVRLSPEGDAFTRRGESFYGFLHEVVSGARVLRQVPIRPAKGGPASVQLAWVRATDLNRYESARAEHAKSAARAAAQVNEPATVELKAPPTEGARVEPRTPLEYVAAPTEQPQASTEEITSASTPQRSVWSNPAPQPRPVATVWPTWLKRLREVVTEWLR